MGLEERGFDSRASHASFCEQFQEQSRDQRRGPVLFQDMFSTAGTLSSFPALLSVKTNTQH